MFSSVKIWCWIFLTVVLLGSREVAAQEPTPSPAPGADCSECHLDTVTEWQDSIHAQAYHDAAFQEAWQAQDSKTECLACHTTGFTARNGEYEQAGVTCKACHGETPATHPPDAVSVDVTVDICADCHTTTYSEWKASLHGEQQLACTTCHTPHRQELRFATANELCLNCHTEAQNDYAHVTHLEQTCVDCHWYRSLDETAHIMTGNLLPTGHDSQVETHTCVDCHENLPENAETVAVSESEHPLLETQIRIDELEAEVKSTQAEGDNQAAIRLMAGLVLGIAVTGVGFQGFAYFRRRRA